MVRQRRLVDGNVENVEVYGGGLILKEIQTKSWDQRELNPKGFLLANPGKQSPGPNSKGIECGKCHAIVYSPEREFDMTAFKIALKEHYVISPDCAD